MVLFNYATKEITLKVVYYGPGLCGKTTNLQNIHQKLNPQTRGKLISLATETDRTLFFDFLPMELGMIRGFRVRFQLYTVPGQVYYNATRKLVLKGAGGVLFIADSQKEMMERNVESFQNLKENLRINNLDPDTIPLVLQYNKRDLDNLSFVEELEARLNTRRVPFFEAVATTGRGVIETFKETARIMIKELGKKHQFGVPAAPAAVAQAPVPPREARGAAPEPGLPGPMGGSIAVEPLPTGPAETAGAPEASSGIFEGEVVEEDVETAEGVADRTSEPTVPPARPEETWGPGPAASAPVAPPAVVDEESIVRTAQGRLADEIRQAVEREVAARLRTAGTPSADGVREVAARVDQLNVDVEKIRSVFGDLARNYEKLFGIITSQQEEASALFQQIQAAIKEHETALAQLQGKPGKTWFSGKGLSRRVRQD
ncbi:MAG: GTPase domain-containing protein [Nitrospirae bacterium]|nr:GTPase domain-containing protein [Nitrospirota bacterium]